MVAPFILRWFDLCVVVLFANMGRTEYAVAAAAKCKGAQVSEARQTETMPKVPKASTHVAGSPLKKANTKSADAPAYICISRVASEALLYENDEGGCLFPGINTYGSSVYMVAVSHSGAYPSVDFKMTERFDAFLQVQHAEVEGSPKSWEEMAKVLHAVPVVTGAFVPYNLPYMTWQRVVYIGGAIANVRNFVLELDNLIVHLTEQPTKPKFGNFPLKIQIGMGVELELKKEDFDYKLVEIEVQVENLCVSPLNVYPPQGVRHLIVHVEIVGTTQLAMTFFGDTYRHRVAFRENGLDMSKEEPTDVDGMESSNPYFNRKRLETFYIMKTTDITDPTNADYVKALLSDLIHNVVVDVRLVSKPEPETEVSVFLQSLKTLHNLFFRDV